METLKIVWHYIAALLPVAGIFGGLFAGFYFGTKSGYRWGKEDAEQWLKIKIWSAIEARIGYPLSFWNASRGGKEKVRVQGILELDYPDPADTEIGLLINFKFIPDKTQWKLGSCCPPHQKSESAT